ncbi:MAG: GNAT family N-acetyltransferase [Oscillospiraceae bacterium]|nr:GNAT family N-acetyltransferase [Oscillospiraceae bacterium]
MDYIIKIINPKELEKLNPLFTAEDTEKFIKERAERIENRDVDVYVIESDNHFIGEVTIVFNDKRCEDYTIPNRRVYMEGFRVLDEYQNKGIGQYFLSQVVNKIKEQGYSEITIGVADDNENAKHIYSKHGFTEFVRRDPGNEYDPHECNVYLKRL